MIFPTSFIIFLATYLIWGVFAVFGFYLFFKSKEKIKDFSLVFIASIFSYLLSRFFGLFYGHLQPFIENNLKPIIEHAANNSFPSDHSALASVFATVLFIKDKKLGIIAFILAIFIAWGRVLALVHYKIDVIFGLLIGIFSAILANYIFHCIRGYREMGEN